MTNTLNFQALFFKSAKRALSCPLIWAMFITIGAIYRFGGDALIMQMKAFATSGIAFFVIFIALAVTVFYNNCPRD